MMGLILSGLIGRLTAALKWCLERPAIALSVASLVAAAFFYLRADHFRERYENLRDEYARLTRNRGALLRPKRNASTPNERRPPMKLTRHCALLLLMLTSGCATTRAVTPPVCPALPPLPKSLTDPIQKPSWLASPTPESAR